MKIIKHIETFNLSDIIPQATNITDNWCIRLFDRGHYAHKSNLSPNRRDFYWIFFSNKGTGQFTIGSNSYFIDKPTLFIIYPNDIVSWMNISITGSGYHCFIAKDFVNKHPQLKTILTKYGLFEQKERHAMALSDAYANTINDFFGQMQSAQSSGNFLFEDTMQAYLQLLMLQISNISEISKPDTVCNEFKHVQYFFNLLDKETANINFVNPIRIKTVKEFAAGLSVHPNHLNALLKKHTGENVSSHIRRRLLEECKVFLRQTDWSCQDISYSFGFSEQSNFNLFFKKNTGFTPLEFRKMGFV